MRKNPYAWKTENITRENLIEDYLNLGSVNKIAIKYKVDPCTIARLLDLYQINYDSRKRNKIENIFQFENEVSFYLAGFIAADGNIFDNVLQIHLGLKDEDHLMLIRYLLGSDHKIIIRNNHKSEMNGKQFSSSTKGFNITSSIMIDDLLNQFNITPRKSLTLKFPSNLVNHPMIHHFIRGYFDGDGCFSIRNPNIKNKQKKINVSWDLLGTQNFIEHVKLILESNIDLPNNKITTSGNVRRLRYSSNKLSVSIGDWMYKDATIYLDRKYQRYLMAKSLL